MLFRYPDDTRADRPFELNTVQIRPKQAYVFWLNSAQRTLDEFNRRHMSTLVPGQISEVTGNIPAFSNSEARGIVIVDNESGIELVQASYRGTDISAGFGVHFGLPSPGGVEQSVFLSMGPATPGVIFDEQATSSSPLSEPISNVRISQFMYDAPAADDGKEFISIKNYDHAPIDLSGFMIGDGIFQGEGEGMAKFPEGTIIEPGQELFLCQSGLIFKAVYGAIPDFEFPWFGKDRLYNDPDVPTLIDANWSTGTIRLGNGGDKLLLMDRYYRVVDFVPYLQNLTYREIVYRGSTARADGNGHSIQRISLSSNLTAAFQAAPVRRPIRRIETPPSQSLLITEFLYTPYFDEGTNEYVEISNITGQAIDLSGYYFGNKVEENGVANKAMYQFPQGAVLPPYTPALIARNARAVKTLYGVTPDYEMEATMDNVPKLIPNCSWGCGSFQMANGGDAIILLDADKKLVDAALFKNALCYGLTAHPGVSAKGHSLERVSAIDTKNPSRDFVEQPNPTPKKMLFGPNGAPELIPFPEVKEFVLDTKEAASTLAALPTLIDSSFGMPASLPENTASFLIKVDSHRGELLAINRHSLLSDTLDEIKDKRLPLIELDKATLVPAVHTLLKQKQIDDCVIISTQVSIIQSMRTLYSGYAGALRVTSSYLQNHSLADVIRAVRRSTCFTAILPATAVTAETVRFFRNRAVTIWASGAENELAIQQLIASGIAGIETAYPLTAARALNAFQTKDSLIQQPLLIAHRGVNSLAPENTMPAIELAYERGIEAVEIDIMVSKDGVPVVIHDYTVNRTTDGSGYVVDMTVAELKQLTANKTDNPEWEDIYAQYPNVTIPTLEEVFAYIKGKELILSLEIKTNGLEAQVAQLIDQYDVAAQVYLSGFNPVVMSAIQALNPEVGALHILSGLGPYEMTALQHAEKTARQMIRRGMFTMPGDDALTPELIRFAKHRGLPLVGGTTNSRASIQSKKRRGITMIYSDYPQWNEQMPLQVNQVPAHLVLFEGESIHLDDYEATVQYRPNTNKPLSGGFRLLGEDHAVAAITTTRITAQSAGTQLFHLYHEYQPFNYRTSDGAALLPDRWRMFSNPVQLTVIKENQLSAKLLLEALWRARRSINTKSYLLLSFQASTILFLEKTGSKRYRQELKQFRSLIRKQVDQHQISLTLFDELDALSRKLVEL
ncbi:glycerophosphodiester phosphodiesterase family protein [Shouchella patagoniensis]|uniref:glycerophosphodiester phosphodiesterase family protein n=1 Tax=Shouchella patagoniensis TaxID=228576 RepID=UPI00099494B0|nr:glycerophosphodiester phosphodiesterase family protein [Shouchella patagoniensis]